MAKWLLYRNVPLIISIMVKDYLINCLSRLFLSFFFSWYLIWNMKNTVLKGSSTRDFGQRRYYKLFHISRLRFVKFATPDGCCVSDSAKQKAKSNRNLANVTKRFYWFVIVFFVCLFLLQSSFLFWFKLGQRGVFITPD